MGDLDLAEAIAELLDGRDLACAESFTAGRVSSAFAAVEGASEWFRGGLVAYQVGTKRALLGVTADHVVTEQAAVEMAEGAGRLLDAPVTVATTGLAGDDPDGGVPAGTVVIATQVDGRCRVRVRRLEDEPIAVCERATSLALEDLLEHLRDPAPTDGAQPASSGPTGDVAAPPHASRRSG